MLFLRGQSSGKGKCRRATHRESKDLTRRDKNLRHKLRAEDYTIGKEPRSVKLLLSIVLCIL